MLDEGVEGAVLVIGRTAVFNSYGSRLRDYMLEFLDEARFADARLATEQNHLACAVLGLRPPFPQEAEF